jgi:hypothetical protein
MPGSVGLCQYQKIGSDLKIDHGFVRHLAFLTLWWTDRGQWKYSIQYFLIERGIKQAHV